MATITLRKAVHVFRYVLKEATPLQAAWQSSEDTFYVFRNRPRWRYGLKRQIISHSLPETELSLEMPVR